MQIPKSQTQFSTVEDTVTVHSLNPDNVRDFLQPKVYIVCYSQLHGFYLKIHFNEFKVPKKIFGNTNKRAEKILNTFKTRNNTTGVLLTGDKGSGKTLLMNVVCNKALEEGLATVLVSEHFHDYVGLGAFLYKLGKVVVVFDEFVKTYKENQSELLTFLDGSLASNKLVLFSENEVYAIDKFLIDRPSRIFYHFRYSKMEEDAIREFCDYHEINEVVEDIVITSKRMSVFSIDILQAICEEYKRYGETIEEIIQTLNVPNGNEDMTVLTVKSLKTVEGVDIPSSSWNTKTFIVDLIGDYWELLYYSVGSGGDVPEQAVSSDGTEQAIIREETESDCIRIRRSNLKWEDGNQMIFSDSKVIVVLEKEPRRKFDWRAF